jgi:hypothetical protein
MFSDYSDNARGYLTSPFYDHSGEDELRLSFHYWSETESGFDGVNLQVWDPQDGIWTTLEPLTGYNSVSLSGIDYESGWSGSTGGWVGAVFDLSAHISSQVRFRFQFGSDGGVTGAGFWIDEMAFDTGDAVTAVDPGDLVGSFSIDCAPNPARGALRISLRTPEAGNFEVALYDASGRSVRRLRSGPLPAGISEILWDGRDGSGREVPSGVYFARATAREGSRMARVLVIR